MCINNKHGTFAIDERQMRWMSPQGAYSPQGMFSPRNPIIRCSYTPHGFCSGQGAYCRQGVYIPLGAYSSQEPIVFRKPIILVNLWIFR